MQQYITAEHLSTTDEQNATPEPTREQLMAAYEGRYKPAMLAADEPEANASTNYSYLLDSEGLSVLTEEDLIAYSEGGERPLYLATPAGSGDAEGIDLAANSANRGITEHEDDGDEIPASCPLLAEGDHELLAGLRSRGYAATLSEAAPYAGASMDNLAGGDYPENGVAFLYGHRGHTLLALAGPAATTTDLDKAANRQDADAIGARFEEMAGRAASIHEAFTARLDHLGGSSTLDGAVRSLLDRGHPRAAIRAVISESHRGGRIRISARGKSPGAGQRDRRTRFVTLAGSAEGSLAEAAKRHADDQRALPARRAAARDLARKRGQRKAFAATLVPLKEQNLDPIEQSRALYVERKKARYRDPSGNPTAPRGLSEVKLELAGFCSLETGKAYEAEEHTLYSATAEADSPGDFFRARVKGRILNGLHANGRLTAKTIISTLFKRHSAEILAFTAEGRTMSPQLAEPYNLFTAAARELIEEGTVKHNGRAFVLTDPSERKLPTAAELAAESSSAEWADEEPEVERESGPDPSGADRYAPDQPGAHDGRAIATGPQAPARRPKARRKAAGRVSAMIEEAKRANGAADNAARASIKAGANQAWRKALSVYMGSLAEEDRLELHLQLKGPQRFERMVEAASEPDALNRAAVVLKDEGRLAARASEGYTLVFATGELDRDALSRSLLRVMARGEVAVPEGTRLARRVRATKAAITRESGEPGSGEPGSGGPGSGGKPTD